MANLRTGASTPLRYNPRVRFFLCCLAFIGTANTSHAAPLDDPHAAINRALNFLYKTASDDAAFSHFGEDLLWAFYTISHTAADRLGFPDRRYKSELRKASAKFTAQDFLGFDPAHGPPSMEDPGRYDQWYGALIFAFFGDAYGVRLGAHYRDVLQWLPRLRPYEGHDEDMEFDIFYAITHVIYTVDHYHERSVSGSLLPAELAFLRRKLDEAIDDENPEMVSEALDCLKATGFANDPQVQAGIKFLISTQRPDGSWAGDPDDLYTEYHSAWTGIDGLRDYHFHGQVKRLPVH